MYHLSSEQEAVVNQVRAIAESRIGPHARAVDTEGQFPSDAIAALGREGFLGLTVSPEWGGMGQNLRVACAVLDEIAQHCASTAMVYLMHLCGVACYSAVPGKMRQYLEAAANGNHLSTLAWSERGSRSHFWAPVSQAVTENGHVRITAEKSFVTSAAQADGYVVSTQRPNASGPMDTMLYLVLREDVGFTVSGQWEALGLRGNASAPMKLDRVVVGPERTIGAEGQGLQMMLSVVLPVFQLGNAAISVGLAEAAVRITQKHLTATRYEHLNTTLADIPGQRARLAQARIQTDMARAHLVSVVDAVENPGANTQLLVLEVKAAASEAAIAVTETAMRACGGTAFTKRLELERLFRDARASGVMAPTTDHAYDFIGRALCGMEVF